MPFWRASLQAKVALAKGGNVESAGESHEEKCPACMRNRNRRWCIGAAGQCGREQNNESGQRAHLVHNDRMVGDHILREVAEVVLKDVHHAVEEVKDCQGRNCGAQKREGRA